MVCPYLANKRYPERRMAKRFKAFRIGIALLFFASRAMAVESTFESWNRFTFTSKRFGDFALYGEAQPDHQWDESRQLRQIDLKGALLYYPDATWTVGAGVAWMPSVSPQFVNELRLWETVTATFFDAGGGQKIDIRLRPEQRWIAGAQSEEGAWGLIGFEEVFFNLNSVALNVVDGGFGQTEIFFGPFWQLSRICQIQTGYMNEYSRGTLGNNRMYHVLFTELDFVF
jgi:hypothetical protein